MERLWPCFPAAVPDVGPPEEGRRPCCCCLCGGDAGLEAEPSAFLTGDDPLPPAPFRPAAAGGTPRGIRNAPKPPFDPPRLDRFLWCPPTGLAPKTATGELGEEERTLRLAREEVEEDMERREEMEPLTPTPTEGEAVVEGDEVERRFDCLVLR